MARRSPAPDEVGARDTVHHLGCDIEECPECGHQLLSCGCLDDEFDDGFYDAWRDAG